MAVEEFKYSVQQITPARQVSDEPYLKWIENCAKNKSVAGVLRIQLGSKLNQFDCKDRQKPDRTDPEEVYLLKASIQYLDACIRHHYKREGGFDPARGFNNWLASDGKPWLMNDALTQTLNKAYHHAYTHASEKAEGRKPLCATGLALLQRSMP